MTSPVRITALGAAPRAFHGQIRDLAVRWALEETHTPFEVHLATDAERASPGYRAMQPFGKVPAFEGDGIVLFESGAIVLHIAETRGLLPREPDARALAKSWLFAAVNSLDPDIIALGDIDHWAPQEPWAIARRPAVESMVRERLALVDARVANAGHLAGDFSAADIMMIMVLRQLRHTRLIEERAALSAWRDRCEARPAFQRALAAQLADLARTSAP